MSKLPDLHRLLRYENPLVIRRFKLNHPEFADQAELLFKDLLKYLWLGQRFEHDKQLAKDASVFDFNCVMHQEMIAIDFMWHHFILVTIDYAEFCHTFFGRFIHHVPEAGEEAMGKKVDPVQFEKEFGLFLSYVCDQLGVETMTRWFSVHLTS